MPSRPRGRTSMVDIMIREIQGMNLKQLEQHNMDPLDKDYISYFFAASQAMLLVKWISEGMAVPPERMAYYFSLLKLEILHKKQ